MGVFALRSGRRSILLAGALWCAGCAGPVSSLPPLPKDAVDAELRRQQIAHIRKYYAELHRVDTVAFRIRTANRDDCGKWISAQIGLTAATPRSLPRKYQSYSAEALSLTWARPTAISVVEGSPAALAGIVMGDEIIALNGELIPVSGTAGWMGRWLRRNGEKPVRLDMRRDGVDRTVTVTPAMGCAIPIRYVTTDEANAFTDGDRIVINSGMVALTRTDAQLAAIIGHELAHVNLGHLDKRRFNQIVGAAGGLAIDAAFLSASVGTGGAFSRTLGKFGLTAYSVAFEREADYVGAYYAVRAGYDLTGVEDIWRAVGESHPDSIRFATTHPATPMRFVQMQKVAAEIADKKSRNLPLIPELKSAPTPDGEVAATGDGL